MTLTNENRTDTICQATKHALLVAWGRFSRHLGLSQRLRAAVTLSRRKDAIPGGDLILEFGLASFQASHKTIAAANRVRRGPHRTEATLERQATDHRATADRAPGPPGRSVAGSQITTVVLTNASGQMLEFDADGPFAGVHIRLDGPFVYQFPMPLFQAWHKLWPVSSESVKVQLSALMAKQEWPSLAGALVVPSNGGLSEKVPKIKVLQ